MNEEQTAKMIEMLEGIVQLKLMATTTSQQTFMVEILSMLIKKGVIDNSDIASFLMRLEDASARFSAMPETSRAIGDAALMMRTALLKERQQPS